MRTAFSCFLGLILCGSAMAADPVLAPTKTWFAPSQPLTVKVAAAGEVSLMLTDFTGARQEAKGMVEVAGNSTTDLKKAFPSQMEAAGTYLLYAMPKGGDGKFIGTPLVIGVRSDGRPGAPGGAMVIKVEPLRYADVKTSKGEMKMAFYYDVAPNTVDNFLTLAGGGYYDGLSFHRIVPGFVIQGGDPRGDGTGGPGYQIDAEFNERPHLEGVLSMARSREPNSAGSQFFVCLDYAQTRALDRQYTAFGQVVSGMEAVKAIAALERNQDDRPKEKDAAVIQSVEVKPVTAEENPYPALQKMIAAK